jgi:Tfp pilus assembly protein PilP
MKLITAIVLLGMAGAAWGQNPDIIENTRNTVNAVQQTKTMRENAVLSSSQGQTKAAPASNPPAAAPAGSAHATPKSAGVDSIAKPKVKAVGATSKQPKQRIAVEDKKKPIAAKDETKKTINVTGRRDPFVSPVMNRSMIGSGCSVGKKCLAIEQIDLRGVVKSENGMIAVVVNALDKAYFLRENDPVFNGYVVKITGDSIIFKQTLQDKLGKSFTREVTKKISTPAV